MVKRNGAYFAKQAKGYRVDYVNEIPSEILDSVSDVGGRHKCRTAWFTYSLNCADSAREAGFSSSESVALYNGIKFHLDNSKFRGRLTNASDIRMVDNLLDAVVRACEEKSAWKSLKSMMAVSNN